MIAAVVIAITWVMLNKTRFGKNVYAVGGNLNAAKVSGINVNRTLLGVYAYAGALYGLAGVLESARTGGSNNNYGVGYELDAIAASVVGGVSLMGGIGTVPGIIIGVLIFGVLNYGLTFVGMNPYWQQIIKGIIIVVAVAFDIRKYLTKK
jgi:methyl-galactoside transport system permease protein